MAMRPIGGLFLEGSADTNLPGTAKQARKIRIRIT